jgi:hypothetical protein
MQSSNSSDRNIRNEGNSLLLSLNSAQPLFIATKTLETLVLNGTTTPILLQYIQSEQFPEPNRMLALITMKNLIKKKYGVSLSFIEESNKINIHFVATYLHGL